MTDGKGKTKQMHMEERSWTRMSYRSSDRSQAYTEVQKVRNSYRKPLREQRRMGGGQKVSSNL